MVFHRIESLTEVRNGHRMIVYYLENKTGRSNESLCRTLESAMAMLEKKNDDLLIVKVLLDTEEFIKFQELYKAEVSGIVTLFVVNNEGIPLTNQHIFKEEEILFVVETICKTCILNSISAIELTKFSSVASSVSSCSNENQLNPLDDKGFQPTLSTSQFDQVLKVSKITPKNRSLTSTLNQVESPQCQREVDVMPQDNTKASLPDTQPFSTQLQIRLPDGSRDKQKFDRDALLNEVWVFVSTKYKLKNFDLKTYNHQVFNEEEYEMSLKDLDLYPNGVIIVVPKNDVSNNNNAWITTMIQYGFSGLMTKTTIVFRYIQSLFNMFWNSLFFSNRQPTSSRGERQITSKDASGQSSQKKPNKSSKSFGPGNIHTLKRQEDSDDENNRYNGNSTQQK